MYECKGGGGGRSNANVRGNGRGVTNPKTAIVGGGKPNVSIKIPFVSCFKRENRIPDKVPFVFNLCVTGK